MVSVASLLNPIPTTQLDGHQLPSPCSNVYEYATDHRSSSPPQPLTPLKKEKMCKDGAVFARGKTNGVVRFPPHEAPNEEIAAQHKRFQIYPMGHIGDYCRHIPYNSEKKSFQEKTGRESFEGMRMLLAVCQSAKEEEERVVY